MLRRYLSPETINALKESRVWQNILADPELMPEIRDGHVTVYYRGGALLKELQECDGQLEAQIHRKFVPVYQSGHSDYLSLRGSAVNGLRFTGQVEPLALGFAEPQVLRSYKAAMKQVLSEFPEGRLVHAIALRPENRILDQEITFAERGESRDKIDLCYFDTALKKIVFVEVKRVEDGRLFQTANRPEVLDQLAAYCGRLLQKRNEILDAYRTVVKLKLELGMEGRLPDVPDDGADDMLEKPLLVIGGCSDEERRRIMAEEAAWQPLMAGIKSVAAGMVLCGNSGCTLLAANTQHSRRFI